MNSMDRLHAVDEERSRDIVEEILRAISGIRYGSVEVVIHDARVVQIERKEKVRFDKDGGKKVR